jgi:hypothetical protein
MLKRAFALIHTALEEITDALLRGAIDQQVAVRLANYLHNVIVELMRVAGATTVVTPSEVSASSEVIELGEPPAASEGGAIDTVLVTLPRRSWRHTIPPASVPISEEAVNEVATVFGVEADAARRALQLGFEGGCNTTVGATGGIEDASET